MEKYKGPIINLMYRMVRGPEEAEDLAQTVFLRAFQSAKGYEASAKFSTWIFRIARRLCLNEIRRRGRHAAESIDAGAAEGEESVRRQYADGRTVAAPDACLQRELEGKIREAMEEFRRSSGWQSRCAGRRSLATRR